MREAGELAIGAVHDMPGDHEDETCYRKANVGIPIIGEGRQDAEQHPHNGHGIRRNAQPRKKWHESARQRMDEVEVGDLLDFRRSTDRLSARARRLGLRLRHLRSRLPACLVMALVAGGSLMSGASVAPAVTERPARESPAGSDSLANRSVTQRPTASREPIVINSVSSNIDYGTNTAEFTDIMISQGDSRLTAERASATAVGFMNSKWTFVGRVVIISEPRGLLRADQAILQFREGELTQVTAVGSPAYIEQADSLHPVHGHADQITYDVKQHTVRLDGNAQLADGRNEISAPVFIYNVRDEGFQADSPGKRWGVHIRIPP
jgi:lipopolysaccharide transport protein LptA